MIQLRDTEGRSLYEPTPLDEESDGSEEELEEEPVPDLQTLIQQYQSAPGYAEREREHVEAFKHCRDVVDGSRHFNWQALAELPDWSRWVVDIAQYFVVTYEKYPREMIQAVIEKIRNRPSNKATRRVNPAQKDQCAQYIRTYYRENPNHTLELNMLYRVYASWRTRRNYELMAKPVFSKVLREMYRSHPHVRFETLNNKVQVTGFEPIRPLNF